ncbi:MAG: 50S ribosomal protein L17 [Halobacteriovorax sp.]|nr:50S ribosomal protein L17 [Halobacteriovorax sp.]|tara:strand:+ start:208 stop:564 length:357 start_codon:yes stop_codon:yes gene_type:complete
MRHQRHKHRIGTSPSHRTSLLRNLATEVIDHGKIKTTHTKCKAVQGFVEKLITLAKEDTVANRRLAFSKLDNKLSVQKLFTEVAPKFKERNGGYTRVLKLADGRWGDNAPMSYIMLVD